jgi:hypothetical protein
VESKVNYQEHLFPEFIQKAPNRSHFGGFVGARSSRKEGQGPHSDIQQESLKEIPPKLLHGNSKKRLRKSPKRKNGKNTNKT